MSVEIGADVLRGRTRSVLVALGTGGAVADEVARHLVRAEQSGHASHGLLRLPLYADDIEEGIIEPRARPAVLGRSRAGSLVDAQFGFGHAAAARATELVAESAAEHGVGIASVRRCTHIGRLGEYPERLSAQSLVSMLVVGAVGPGVGSMAIFGSRTGRAFLNTNPWAIGFPASNGAVIFDAAMSIIPEGKVHAAQARGDRVPEGSLLDRDGQPSSDPDAFVAGGTLMPLGGAAFGHKGSGLALAAALIGGLAYADGTAPQIRGLAHLDNADGAGNTAGGVTIVAIDPNVFGERDEYRSHVDAVAAAISADGALVPGELEHRRRESAGDSVTLAEKTYDELAALEVQLGLSSL